MNGFRILNLKVTKHPILGTNDFKFYDEKDKDEKTPYFTVLIGPNGTGKSEILRCLLLIFRDFYQQIADFEYRPLQFSYTLNYTLKGKEFIYSNSKEGTFNSLTKGKRGYLKAELFDKNWGLIPYKIDGYNEKFPLQIVAQSIMMTDKFFVPRNSDDTLRFSPYHYLGIRNRPQQASTGAYVRRTVGFILKAIDKKYFERGIQKLAKYIDTSGSFIIEYKTSNTKQFYNGRLTAEILDEYFTEIEKRYIDRQAPYKLGHFKKLKKGTLKFLEVVNLVNSLVNESTLEKIEKSSAKKLTFDLQDTKQMNFLKRNESNIDWLRKIGLLSLPKLKFSDKDVELQKASSGEFHLFTTMIGLMASVRKDSLVIIDEPEISLHPNWQMRYIQFIRELFDETDRISSHIIIATHSHFLISDLPAENSNIIGLRKEQGEIKSLEISKSTYGWSAEEVLYKVFGVKTTRNFFLEAELRELLHGIAIKSQNKVRLQEIVTQLELLEFSKDDPLNIVIARAKNYLND